MASVGEDGDPRELCRLLAGARSGTAAVDTVWRFLTVRPRNPTPQESKTCVHTETCAQMFTVAVSTTTRAWTQAERPSTGAGINP